MTTPSLPSCAQAAADFAETPYGIVKRLRTIERWTAWVGGAVGKSALSILDYGCGTGDHVTYPLARLGHRVLGVDLHAASVEEAQRRYRLPNLTFRAADVEVLAREGTQYDLVVCSEVLEHLYDPLSFLRTVNRLIVPAGGLIITTPNGYGTFEWLSSLERTLDRMGINRLLRRARRAIRRASPDALGSDPQADSKTSIGFLNMDSKHVQFFRLEELESLFERGGFHVVDKQARTVLCGPYIDLLLHALPCRDAVFRLNDRAADRLPMQWAADWMYLLQPNRTTIP